MSAARSMPCLLVAVVTLAGCYRVEFAGMSYEPPDGWIREEPTSEHRLIQYRLKGDGKADGDARLVVYYFGEQGIGDVDANIERWAAQFRQPDGRPALEVASVGERVSNGLDVHTVKVEGTYVAKDADGEPMNRPDRSMRAAVVYTEAGPYYFKVVGPTPTVRRWEPSYRDLLASIAPAPVKPDPEESEVPVEEVTP